MKAKIEVECTPEEARAFLGLPDVSSINERMVSEVLGRIEKNAALLDVEPLLKTWGAIGGQAQETFFRLFGQAMTGGSGSSKPGA